MMKSLKQLLLISLAVLLCAASFVACDVEAPETPNAPGTSNTVTAGQDEGGKDEHPDSEAHTHAFGGWTVTENPTCTQNGKEERSCSCGQSETRYVPVTEHDFVGGICSMCGLNQGSDPVEPEDTTENTTENTPEPPPAPENANQNPETTEIYDGITVTRLPYYANGILVNSISFSDTKVIVNITNLTGHAIESFSSIRYKYYDDGNTVLNSGDLYLESLNHGESANVHFYAEEKMTKLLFGEATIYVGEEFGSGETAVYDGITANQLPYEVSGLKVTALSFDNSKVTITVINNTGHAIKSITSIAYKCYDENGIIVRTDSLYLKDMNNGEAAKVYFYAPEGTVKILFGNATVYEGIEAPEGETAVYDGITVTKIPYEVMGLKITSVSYNNRKVTVTVKNNTGNAIKHISSINYKCYDSDGFIVRTDALYLEDLNNGESAEVYFYAEEGTSKILFTTATVYEGDSTGDGETAVYDGITVTKLPYYVKGLKVSEISFSGTKVTVTVTNLTGYAIQNISSIAYKCYGTDGQVLETGDLYLADLNNGETAEVYFYAANGTSKIIFGDATLYETSASGSSETDVYDGITVNKLPYEVDGLIVTAISFSGTKVTVKVVNNTGRSIKGITSITYKCYGLDGNVLGTGDLYLEDMNHGETAEVHFYAEEGTGKIIFGDATIYN